MKKIQRIYVHNIKSKDTLSEFEAKEYSFMKYGDPIVARRSAIHLASRLLNDKKTLEKIRSHEITFIASSAHGIVPTASHAIAKDVCRLLESIGLNVRTLKIHRDGDFATNCYGTLSASQRKEKMASRQIYLDEESLEGIKDNFIIAIDDILVTGSHESKLHKVLLKTQADDWLFAYLMKLDKKFAKESPEYEEYLNRAAIQKATQMFPFFQIPFGPDLKFRVNSRALKFLLTTAPESPFDPSSKDKINDLNKFYSKLTDIILAKVYRASISSDGYVNSEKYAKGLEILNAHVRRRPLVRRLLK